MGALTPSEPGGALAKQMEASIRPCGQRPHAGHGRVGCGAPGVSWAVAVAGIGSSAPGAQCPNMPVCLPTSPPAGPPVLAAELDELEREEFFRLKKVQKNKQKKQMAQMAEVRHAACACYCCCCEAGADCLLGSAAVHGCGLV